MNDMTLEEYFKDHPEEENEFIDEMARLELEKGPIDYPEDWSLKTLEEWLQYA